ncbi:hypothetical protein ABI59_18245 [Acidobacteria bacterium Mor1]|nr:hypothetical protein ABI59_18245 [Acidobacteria bacterium Mor1]
MSGEIERRYLELIERNRGRIDRLARSWARNPAEREDLRSEILLQLWRSLPGFDGRSGEDTWLFRVTLNVAMLHGRSRSRRERGREELEARAPTPPPAVDPGQRLDDQDRLERLRQAIAELPPPDRALIALHLEDLPYREIAEITGMNENHIGVRLHRLRAKLSRRLAKQEVDHDSR